MNSFRFVCNEQFKKMCTLASSCLSLCPSFYPSPSVFKSTCNNQKNLEYFTGVDTTISYKNVQMYITDIKKLKTL